MELDPVSHLRVTGSDGQWQPKHMDIVAGLFVATYLIANILAPKLFVLGPVTLGAGILTFPLCCLFGDVLTEVYGFNRTRRVIWLGFFCNLLLSVMSAIALRLPPAPDWHGQEAFVQTFAHVPRIFIASFAAYLISEFINSFIMSRMKLKTGSRGFAWRAIASTSLAQIVDTITFLTIAFLGLIPFATLVHIIISYWVAKVVYEIVMIPATTVFVRWLKRLEGVEHFDRQKLTVFEL